MSKECIECKISLDHGCIGDVVIVVNIVRIHSSWLTPCPCGSSIAVLDYAPNVSVVVDNSICYDSIGTRTRNYAHNMLGIVTLWLYLYSLIVKYRV